MLRVNGARIRAWWIRGHYYSIAACAVALTWPDGAGRRAFGRRYQCWAAAQGLVFSLQNRYQRKRTYTRIALGRASAMDVAAGEATAVGGQLRLLFPMLFALQAAELGCALAVLRGARADRLWQPWAVGALLAVQGAGNFLYTAAALFEKRRAAPGIAGR